MDMDLQKTQIPCLGHKNEHKIFEFSIPRREIVDFFVSKTDLESPSTSPAFKKIEHFESVSEIFESFLSAFKSYFEKGSILLLEFPSYLKLPLHA